MTENVTENVTENCGNLTSDILHSVVNASYLAINMRVSMIIAVILGCASCSTENTETPNGEQGLLWFSDYDRPFAVPGLFKLTVGHEAVSVECEFLGECERHTDRQLLPTDTSATISLTNVAEIVEQFVAPQADELYGGKLRLQLRALTAGDTDLTVDTGSVADSFGLSLREAKSLEITGSQCDGGYLQGTEFETAVSVLSEDGTELFSQLPISWIADQELAVLSEKITGYSYRYSLWADTLGTYNMTFRYQNGLSTTLSAVVISETEVVTGTLSDLHTEQQPGANQTVRIKAGTYGAFDLDLTNNASEAVCGGVSRFTSSDSSVVAITGRDKDHLNLEYLKAGTAVVGAQIGNVFLSVDVTVE